MSRHSRTTPLAISACAVLIFLCVELRAAASEDPSERWGRWTWLSPWVETTLRYSEPRNGEFQLSGALFGGRWTAPLDHGVLAEAQISVGTRNLLLRPTRYAPRLDERPSDASIVDAFSGVESYWGQLRVGLVPVLFGLEEGHEPERQWLRPLILRQGLIAARDLGVSYRIATSGFESYWLIHNGEGAEDRDHEIWATARVEYRVRNTRSSMRVGASGQVGRTTRDSTHPTGTTATATEIDADQPARLKFGSLHFQSIWEIGDGERGTEGDRQFGVEVQSFAGEAIQDAQSRRLRGVRSDVFYEPWTRTGFLVRYDMLDPDTQSARDMLQEFSVGVQHFWLNGDMKRAFRTLLVGTKEVLEGRSVDQHRFELAFRFSPDL